MIRRFEFVEGNSSKFYEVQIDGTTVTVRYGRIGTDGQTLTKEFTDAGKAQAHADKLIAQKLAKGYVECAVR
jgi:predicted DNA-binding WGR domain protein